jgi:hypothetical protein
MLGSVPDPGLDPDSIGSVETNPGRTNWFPKKEKNEVVSSLKSSQEGWKLLLELGCPYE